MVDPDIGCIFVIYSMRGIRKWYQWYLDGNVGKIFHLYLAFSTKTKKFYIGETQNFKSRIQAELRNAKKKRGILRTIARHDSKISKRKWVELG